MVASKRLLAAASLNQSLVVPEFFSLPAQALRIETLMLLARIRTTYLSLDLSMRPAGRCIGRRFTPYAGVLRNRR